METALSRQFDTVLPYAPDLFIDSINTGKPLLYNRPDESVSEVLLGFARELSRPEHRSRISPLPGSTRDPIKRILTGLK